MGMCCHKPHSEAREARGVTVDPSMVPATSYKKVLNSDYSQSKVGPLAFSRWCSPPLFLKSLLTLTIEAARVRSTSKQHAGARSARGWTFR